MKIKFKKKKRKKKKKKSRGDSLIIAREVLSDRELKLQKSQIRKGKPNFSGLALRVLNPKPNDTTFFKQEPKRMSLANSKYPLKFRT